jgi:hypothetical protein
MLTNPVSSLDTGQVKSGFNEVNTPFSVSIKLWGFDDTRIEISDILGENLPKSMITESRYPSEDKIDQFYISTGDAFFGVNNKINYEISSMHLFGQFDFLLNNIPYYANSNETEISASYYNGTDFVSQTGAAIDMSGFSNLLELFNEKNTYTLHLLNLTQVNNLPANTHSKHWYRLGDLQNAPLQSDIRNVGLVGTNGIFYDPSASAPLFDTDYLHESNITEIGRILTNRITELIENIIVGSPYTFNYNTDQKKFHFDQIIIGTPGDDYNTVKEQLSPNQSRLRNFEIAIKNLLPYMDITTRNIEISTNLNNHKTITNYINSLEDQSSNTSGTYIKITDQVAEKFKSMIRDNYHDQWPSGFYFSLFIFVDTVDRTFLWDTSSGEQEYSFGKVGFGIVNLKEWRNLLLPERDSVSLLGLALRGFGNLIGIPALNNKFASQVESPMSNYGVTNLWDSKYGQFEIDAVARRVSMYFNNSAIHDLKAFRIDLKQSAFRWMDRGPLDDAELTLRLANIEYQKGNFTGAAKLFMEGYSQWIDARDKFIQNKNGVINGIELTVIIIVALYLISTLKLFILTKEEFYKKIKNS